MCVVLIVFSTMNKKNSLYIPIQFLNNLLGTKKNLEDKGMQTRRKIR